MFGITVLLLVVQGVSVYGLHRGGRVPRWPFWCRPCFGAATLLVVMTALITLTVGRSTWNSWVSGSQSSETITSWLMVLVGPVLVATCCVPFVVSAVLRTRHRRRSKQGAIFVPSHP